MSKEAIREIQDLLAERRANVQELRRERDAIARGCLQAHIDYLDREVAKRMIEGGS